MTKRKKINNNNTDNKKVQEEIEEKLVENFRLSTHELIENDQKIYQLWQQYKIR